MPRSGISIATPLSAMCSIGCEIATCHYLLFGDFHSSGAERRRGFHNKKASGVGASQAPTFLVTFDTKSNNKKFLRHQCKS